ncbi:MAG TPA: cytochrome c [Acetobacteraceae bacterium]|jgi:cytochrome c556|nr:cytochrome c [Acetobacteraceae bacterium]
MTRKLAVFAVLAMATAGTAGAAGYDPIETRQAGQDLLLGSFSGIKVVVVTKGDVKTLEQPAKAIARWITQFPTQFPKGSDQGHNTKALPAVWTEPAEFQNDANNLAKEATKLAELAKAGDTEAVAAQVKVVGDACATCHKTFRAK